MFVKALVKLEGGLEEGMQHGSRFVGGKPVRSIFMPPKRRTLTLPSGRRLHGHPHCSVGSFRRAVMNKIVDDILLAQPVASRDGVLKMVLKLS